MLRERDLEASGQINLCQTWEFDANSSPECTMTVLLHCSAQMYIRADVRFEQPAYIPHNARLGQRWNT